MKECAHIIISIIITIILILSFIVAELSSELCLEDGGAPMGRVARLCVCVICLQMANLHPLAHGQLISCRVAGRVPTKIQLTRLNYAPTDSNCPIGLRVFVCKFAFADESSQHYVTLFGLRANREPG